MLRIGYRSEYESERNGEYTFYYKSVTIGFDTSHDLIIDGHDDKRHFFLLKNTKRGLLVQPSNEKFPYLSNGKKIYGAIYHQQGDSIEIEGIEFSISALEFQPETHYDADNLEHNKITLLEEVENEILHIEKELNVQK